MNPFCVRRLDERPDPLAVHARFPDAWPFLLSSEAGSASLGRWTLLFRHDGTSLRDNRNLGETGFLERLRRAAPVRASVPNGSERGPFPFVGGWFVYLGYEVAAEIEPRLRLPEYPGELPTAFAARCPAALLINHFSGESWLVAETQQWLERTLAEVSKAQPLAACPELPTLGVEVDPPERFAAGVNRIREWIVSGDVFQVNLSREWRISAAEPLDPIVLYRRLAHANAAPFAGLARLPGGTVISSSPERLVELRAGLVQTRPIAGTRTRGTDSQRDLDLSTELLAHPKERAEHIMLIDLERNDLGRVCETGSIEVDELMVVESYAHVHHIVSNLRGRLREGLHPVDVIGAVFPGGTITGCPKVRCMEIIAELEQCGRGFYTGSMGYLGLDGSMDLNILIRSLQVQDRCATFRTGAGIVADSDAQAEVAETVAKARGLLRALGQS